MPEPGAEEKIKVAILHMDRLIALKGEAVAVREMRKHLAWYLKGFRAAARVKDHIMEGTERDEMVRILHDFVDQLRDEEDQDTGAALMAL
ncbi:tRNA-dihydrouridine synthase B [compost metagenome]